MMKKIHCKHIHKNFVLELTVFHSFLKESQGFFLRSISERKIQNRTSNTEFIYSRDMNNQECMDKIKADKKILTK